MNVYFGTNSLPKFKNAVITIGTFDGVHTGHQFVINALKQKACEIDGESIIITFEPHPRLVITDPQQPVFLLNTLEEKIENLKNSGVDHTIVVEFTKEFAEMGAEEYIKDFLVKNFHPNTIIIGYDHRFGKGRKGDIQLLEKYQEQYHFHLEEIPIQAIEQKKISSTFIRKALKEGDLQTATNYLGRLYSLSGVVVKRNQLGRKIGFPTANLVLQNTSKLLPAMGVYAVEIHFEGKVCEGMMNVGTNPTIVDDKAVKLEVHIFDFDQEIYGKILKISFVERLRDEKKFEHLNDLIEAIRQDEMKSKRIFLNKKNNHFD